MHDSTTHASTPYSQLFREHPKFAGSRGCFLLSILASGNSWKRLIVCMLHLPVNSSRQLVRASLHVWRHLMENGPFEAWCWLCSENSKLLLYYLCVRSEWTGNLTFHGRAIGSNIHAVILPTSPTSSTYIQAFFFS